MYRVVDILKSQRASVAQIALVLPTGDNSAAGMLVDSTLVGSVPPASQSESTMINRRFALLLAVTALIPIFCSAQLLPGGPTEDSVASLIMAWRWESNDGKSTIDVSSSNLMLFDGKLYDFELFGGALKFLAGGKSVPYRYDGASDRLTLEFPDAPPLDYHRTIQSVLTRRGTGSCPRRPSSSSAGSARMSGVPVTPSRSRRRLTFMQIPNSILGPEGLHSPAEPLVGLAPRQPLGQCWCMGMW